MQYKVIPTHKIRFLDQGRELQLHIIKKARKDSTRHIIYLLF